jgi:hypothetical protein
MMTKIQKIGGLSDNPRTFFISRYTKPFPSLPPPSASTHPSRSATHTVPPLTLLRLTQNFHPQNESQNSQNSKSLSNIFGKASQMKKLGNESEREFLRYWFVLGRL